VKQLGERWARANGVVGKGITHGGEPTFVSIDDRANAWRSS
jgi:uncharacterized protein (DUF2126 family)